MVGIKELGDVLASLDSDQVAAWMPWHKTGDIVDMSLHNHPTIIGLVVLTDFFQAILGHGVLPIHILLMQVSLVNLGCTFAHGAHQVGLIR